MPKFPWVTLCLSVIVALITTFLFKVSPDWLPQITKPVVAWHANHSAEASFYPYTVYGLLLASSISSLFAAYRVMNGGTSLLMWLSLWLWARGGAAFVGAILGLTIYVWIQQGFLAASAGVALAMFGVVFVLVPGVLAFALLHLSQDDYANAQHAMIMKWVVTAVCVAVAVMSLAGFYKQSTQQANPPLHETPAGKLATPELAR